MDTGAIAMTEYEEFSLSDILFILFWWLILLAYIALIGLYWIYEKIIKIKHKKVNM